MTEKKSKTYVLDTNVLIQAPHALLSFEDNSVVLPVVVLEELDRLKNEEGERGANARQVVRMLDGLRTQGSLTEGVSLSNGGHLRIEMNCTAIDLPAHWSPACADNRILQVCKGLHEKGVKAILVSRDIIVRIKADILKIPAEDFLTDQAPKLEQQYSGRMIVLAPDDKMIQFKKKGIKPEQLYFLGPNGEPVPIEPIHNQFFIIQSELSNKKSLLGRYNGKLIVPLTTLDEQPFGVRPRTVGQRFLQEALMTDADEAP